MQSSRAGTTRTTADSRPLDADAEALAFALSVARIGVFEIDVRTGARRFSSTCCELWGLEPDETPTAEGLRELADTGDLERALARSLRPDAPDEISVEQRIERPDGDVRWLAICGRTLFEGEGPARVPVRIRGTMRDVTERRLASERYEATLARLRESEQRFRTIFEQTNDFVFTADLQQRITSCNPSVAAAIGLPPHQLLGRSIGEFVPPDQFARTSAMLAQKLREAGTTRYEVEVGSRECGLRTWEVNSTLTFGPDGAPTGLHAIARDVTEQRRIRSQLERSEARLQIALESAGAGVSDWNVDTGEVEWTAGCYTLLGLEPGREKPSRELWRRHIHREDLDRVDAGLAKAIACGGTFAADYRVVGADGVERWVQDRARVLRGPLEPRRVLSARIDVTDRKRANDRLREADRRKDEFLATLAHELRNPLAPIRTAAQLLGMPGLSGAQLEKTARIVQRQVSHMAYLLDDLLDVARITRGKLEIRPTWDRLDAIVDAAVEAARPLLDAKSHTLRVDVPSPAPSIYADGQRLSQVLSNLLTNAAKYTDPGGHVDLVARELPDGFELRVRDDGIGLTPEERASIFQMFSQVHDTRHRSEGGLGIGLALVRGLVALHGGTIDVHSDGPRHGSEFVVKLPKRPPATRTEPDAPAPPAVEGAGPADVSQRRVLVADDNRDAAESLAMLLRLRGHDVRVAHGGREALAVAEAFRPDAAVLDIGMPDLDGYGVATQLRRNPWSRDMLLIALTGWGQYSDQWDAHLAGFDHHVTKPADVERLDRLLAAPPLASPLH